MRGFLFNCAVILQSFNTVGRDLEFVGNPDPVQNDLRHRYRDRERETDDCWIQSVAGIDEIGSETGSQKATQNIDSKRHPSVETVEGGGGSGVAVKFPLGIRTERILRTICPDGYHTRNSAVQLRVDRTLCVGHLPFDTHLAVNVSVAEPSADETQNKRNPTEFRHEVDQIAEAQKQRDCQFHEGNKQSLEASIDSLDVFGETGNDSGDFGGASQPSS